MIILKELIKAAGTVTRLELDLRKPDGRLIKQYYIGEGMNEEGVSEHVWDRVKRGQVELIDTKINHRGDKAPNGMSETRFWANLDGIPADLLETQVTSFWQSDRTFGGDKGSVIHAHVCRIQQTLGDMLEGGTP